MVWVARTLGLGVQVARKAQVTEDEEQVSRWYSKQERKLGDIWWADEEWQV